jgi:hypothetical protein
LRRFRVMPPWLWRDAKLIDLWAVRFSWANIYWLSFWFFGRVVVDVNPSPRPWFPDRFVQVRWRRFRWGVRW